MPFHQPTFATSTALGQFYVPGLISLSSTIFSTTSGTINFFEFLKFYYQNDRGLSTITKDFFQATSACNCNNIALTET